MTAALDTGMNSDRERAAVGKTSSSQRSFGCLEDMEADKRWTAPEHWQSRKRAERMFRVSPAAMGPGLAAGGVCCVHSETP